MRTSLLAVTLVTGASLLVASLTSPAVAASSTLDWQGCTQAGLRTGGFECATLEVPMDRTDAGAGTFRIAVARHRSTGSADQRIGSLFFNPGGPGGSGLDTLPMLWAKLPPSVASRFDIVTWDPRGIGATRPVLRDCAMPYPDRPATGAVDWAAVVRGFASTVGAANRTCQRANAAFIEHMGTSEVVQDLDRLRAAVGDERLSYWGMSYGTRIGYVYALTFPDRVRAVILDGSIDPASTLLSLSEGGAAPDQAYGSFADAYPDADRKWRDVQAVLDQRTVALPNDQVLDRWVMADAVYGNIAQQAAYPDLARIIDLAHDVITGAVEADSEEAQSLASLVASLRNAPNSNAGGAFAVVNCLDYAGRPGPARQVAAVRTQDRLGPDYGGSLTTMYATNCAGFTFAPDPIPVVTGAGSPVPVLVLGASRDGSTIVQWTARMSRAFPQSRTVTYAGGQHVTWMFADSPCVNRIANAYVLGQQLPAMDRGCPNTVTPQR